MKILVTLTYYHPHWTGLTQYAIFLAEKLVQLNCEVKVVTTQHDCNLPIREVVNGVDVERCRVVSKISRSAVSLEMLFKVIRKIIWSDVVIAFLPFGEALWISWWCWIFHKKLYFIYNGDLILTEGIFNRIVEKVYFGVTRAAIKLSNGVVVNTTDYANNSPLLLTVREKWITIVPPISIPKLQPKKHSWPRVGFSGRFVYEKGFDILLRAIPKITSSYPKAKFVFAGVTHLDYENTYERNLPLIEAVKDKLEMLGKLNKEEMNKFYNNIDLLVIPSRSDFFPFVQVEALLSGVPVVVTNIPGARWLVETTGAGVIVEKENPDKLAEGIEYALEHKSELAKKTQGVGKIFDQEKVMEQYLKLLK
jgi:glycosyltransferase involved in cell wall biosynthesis